MGTFQIGFNWDSIQHTRDIKKNMSVTVWELQVQYQTSNMIWNFNWY
jgi:hypothetical protein